MTIYELKRRNIANGGCFFYRKNLKANQETLKGFSVTRSTNSAQVVVTRKRDGKAWLFNAFTGRVDFLLNTARA